jgi:hypothetical protein
MFTFHVWSPDGKVLCGESNPDVIVHIDSIRSEIAASLCQECVAKIPQLKQQASAKMRLPLAGERRYGVAVADAASRGSSTKAL